MHRELAQEMMGDVGLMPLWWSVTPVVMANGVKGVPDRDNRGNPQQLRMGQGLATAKLSAWLRAIRPRGRGREREPKTQRVEDGMMVATESVQFREVVVFSGAQPKYTGASARAGESCARTPNVWTFPSRPGRGRYVSRRLQRSSGRPKLAPRAHNFRAAPFYPCRRSADAPGRATARAGWGISRRAFSTVRRGGMDRAAPSCCSSRAQAGRHSIVASRAERPRGKCSPRGATFEGGLCIWPDGRKEDGADALHDFIDGEKMVYPPARYAEQVWINTENYSWEPSGLLPGVPVKRLAFFNDGRALRS